MVKTGYQNQSWLPPKIIPDSVTKVDSSGFDPQVFGCEERTSLRPWVGDRYRGRLIKARGRPCHAPSALR